MGALELGVSEIVFSKEERLDIVNQFILRYKLNFPTPQGQTELEASHLVSYKAQDLEETEVWYIDYKQRDNPNEETISIKGFSPATPRYEIYTGKNPGWVKTEVGKHHPPETPNNPGHLDEIDFIFNKLMPMLTRPVIDDYPSPA